MIKASLEKLLLRITQQFLTFSEKWLFINVLINETYGSKNNSQNP